MAVCCGRAAAVSVAFEFTVAGGPKFEGAFGCGLLGICYEAAAAAAYCYAFFCFRLFLLVINPGLRSRRQSSLFL